MTRSLARLFALLIPLLAYLVLPAAASAHNTSVTRIDITIQKDSLSVTVNLNQADLLQHVLNRPHDQGRFNDAAELEDAAPAILKYVVDHLPATADGKPVSPPTPSRWPPEHVGLTRTDANGLELPAAIPITLQYALPPGARHVQLQPKLFVGNNFTALFDVSVYPDSTSKPITTVVDKHEPVEIEMPTGPPAVAGAPETEPAPIGFAATFIKYLGLGVNHILGYHDDTLFGARIVVFDGLDHILFVLGLYFLSPKIKQLLLQVTAFTVAHSITLALSAYGVFTLPGRVVEPLIALSITAVAAENLVSRKVHWWRWCLVFGFGLIHGMGFAEIFHETRLPAAQGLAALLSFNLGVEAGQLSILAAAMLATVWWRKREWYFRYIAAPASVVIACTGAVWTVQRILEG